MIKRNKTNERDRFIQDDDPVLNIQFFFIQNFLRL